MRRLSHRLRLIPAIAAFALLSGGVSRPAGQAQAAESAPMARQLVALAAPQALRSTYGLSVVEMPAPPLGALTEGEAAERVAPPRGSAGEPAGCPVQVRAIVHAEGGAESFAVVSAEDDSAVLHVGERVVTSRGTLALVSIAPEHVLFRRGGSKLRCGLASSTR